MTWAFQLPGPVMAFSLRGASAPSSAAASGGRPFFPASTSSSGWPHVGPAVRPLGRGSVAPAPTVTLDDRFARELPELALPWQAEEAPDPRLLVLNEPPAAELGPPARAPPPG